MKKILSLILALATLLALCLSLAFCGGGKGESEIEYGKKYIYIGKADIRNAEYSETIVLKKNGTGTFEWTSNGNAGTVPILWEKTSDGAIHLFDASEDRKTSDGAIRLFDTSENSTVAEIVSYPLYFSENMLYYSTVPGYVRRFFLEGSALYKTVYNKE